MQVLPLLTPTNFNNKKRPRSEDDFESNYLKKRLISSPPPSPLYKTDTPIAMDTRGYVTPPKDRIDTQRNYDRHARIDMLDFNGTILPMEQRTGETKYSIPGFVLHKKSPPPSSYEAAQTGQLILYQPNNTLLPLSPPNTPTHDKQEDDPMDID
ncbi:hypothetical protein INT47_012194 [Mucor saturninus]|uniref:Uncharacterized protein n=1 Tax=Mucor saturninus TaxID=64648 RepID=A0A8H7QVQ3_9FUNG|nr:hypothetical protein INT47_012194 [Mucor saturninus]